MNSNADDFNSSVLEAAFSGASSENENYNLKITLGALKKDPTQAITATPEAMFQDNCIIVGTVGSGKTWTIARIIQECLTFKSKLFMLDLNNEHEELKSKEVVSISLKEVYMPFESLNIWEILSLFKFPDQTQKYIFLEVINNLVSNKETVLKKTIGCGLEFGDILGLINETIEQIGQNDLQTYEVLCSVRNHILAKIQDNVLEPFIQADNKRNLFELIDRFISERSEKKLFRFLLRGSHLENNNLPTMVNLISRYFQALYLSDEMAGSQPMVIFADDAAGFFNEESIKSDGLTGFFNIFTKKVPFNLKACISVASPFDVPPEVLSSTGTFIIQRLKSQNEIDLLAQVTNIKDMEKTLIPIFISGDAMLFNSRLYVPYLLRIAHPEIKPEKKNSLFQNAWK